MSNGINAIQKTVDQLTHLFTITKEIVDAWSEEGNLQFPVLLGMIAVRLNWDEKQVRENDPLIRYYVRNNPEWFVTRGAHGGIMKATDKQKKEEARLAKENAKAQVQAALAAKLAAASTPPEVSNSDTSSDTLEE